MLGEELLVAKQIHKPIKARERMKLKVVLALALLHLAQAGSLRASDHLAVGAVALAEARSAVDAQFRKLQGGGAVTGEAPRARSTLSKRRSISSTRSLPS